MRFTIDSELFVNVVDLGLVYDIGLVGSSSVIITMALSAPHCPMGEAITNGVKNAVNTVFPHKEVDINLTFDPA